NGVPVTLELFKCLFFAGESSMKTAYRFVAGVALLVALAATISDPRGVMAQAQTPTAVAEKPFVVEYYYKAKWGYADEFIRLFKKNHYPVLKKEKELGRILQVSAASPRYHTTEDGRWDYRVTIVWKNVGVTNDGFDSQPLLKQ